MGNTELSQWRDFAELAMIRDTWKKDHPRWKEACAQAMALQFYGSQKMLEMVDSGNFAFADLYNLGGMLVEQAERKTELIAETAFHRELQTPAGTLKTAYFNCTEKLTSDAANLLIDQGADIGIGYFHLFEDGALRVVVSVRTNGRVSAKKIAEFYKGGGHDRAAGFRLPLGEAPGPEEIAEKIRLAI
jgi:nanoRNase/pAp phosphatase (c-di-AMP/oligoRNAs hydrolase)